MILGATVIILSPSKCTLQKEGRKKNAPKVCCFSHRCDQISNRDNAWGREKPFSSWFPRCQSIMVGGHGGSVAVYAGVGQETALSCLPFIPAHEMVAPRLKADFSLQLILSRNILKDVPRCVPVSLMPF